MLSSTLYNNFPKVLYNDALITNLTIRLKFKDIVKKNMAVYYPYTIIEGERPDTLAFKYYDDPNYAWLIFLANDIYDPVYDWPLTSDMFNIMIQEKYGSAANAQNKILFYRVEWASDDSLIDTAAYQALPSANKKYWNPVVGMNDKVTGYERARVDWAVETNKIVRLTATQTDSSVSIAIGDTLYQQTEGSKSAQGTVQAIDEMGGILLKNIVGTFVADNKAISIERDQDVVYGPCTSAIIVANSFTASEENYWAPVTAYEYEMEANEGKKHIVLIDKIYLDVIEKDIRNLLA